MDQLAASYASSSSSEQEEGQSDGRTYATDELLRVERTDREASQVNAAAARAVLAERFAMRARQSTHRTAPEERRFAYRPYAPKRALLSHGRSTRASSATAKIAPLFSTIRSLATRSDALPGRFAGKSALPQWQKGDRMQDHSGAVQSLEWNPRYPPLFLSASMDHSVRVWGLPPSYYDDQLPDDAQRCRRVLAHHARGVKQAKWSIDGHFVWSGSYDGGAVYVDVERNAVVQRFSHNTNEYVTSILPHPVDPQLVLCGTDRGRILLRDLRVDAATPSANYGTKTTGEIHDLLFLPTGASRDVRFLSSSALTSRDTSYQTLLVWDVRSTALVADHLNDDLCAFTNLSLHPTRKYVAAQSTANEIVLFSAHAPYKRLKPKRSYCGGHDVQGFGISCSFNATGSLLATGDVHGRVVLYCGEARRVLRQYSVYDPTTPCLAVAFHPQWPSMLVSGGADGTMELFNWSSSPQTQDEE